MHTEYPTAIARCVVWAKKMYYVMNFNLNVLQHIHSGIADADKSLFCICKMPYDDNRLVIKTIIE